MNQKELDRYLAGHDGNLKTSKLSEFSVDLKGQNLDHVTIVGRNLTGISFEASSLKGAIIRNCNLTGASFERTDSRGIWFKDCIFNDVNFKQANLEGTTIEGCSRVDEDSGEICFGYPERVPPPDFRGANLKNAAISHCMWYHVNMTNANMAGACLYNVGLDHSTLVNVDISNSRVHDVVIRLANCENLKASNVEFTTVAIWGTLTNSDFSMSVFNSGANGKTKLYGLVDNANFEYTRFSSCEVHWAQFVSTNLEHSVFSRSDLDGASFDGCSIAHAVFWGGRLRGVRINKSSLNHSRFINVDLTRTIVQKTTLTDVKFENAKNITFGYLNADMNIGTHPVFYPALLREATVGNVNKTLKYLGHREYVEFGQSGKLKISGLGRRSIYNPFPGKPRGRIYGSMVSGEKPNADYELAQLDCITARNLQYFCVTDILFTIYWLENCDRGFRMESFKDFDYQEN